MRWMHQFQKEFQKGRQEIERFEEQMTGAGEILNSDKGIQDPYERKMPFASSLSPSNAIYESSNGIDERHRRMG
jgi:hypothetical protein